MTQRRQTYRIPVSIPLPRAAVLDLQEDVETLLDATVLDISLTGLQMSVQQAVTNGDLLDLEVPLDNSPSPLVVRAMVIRAVQPRPGGRYRVGCRFTSLAPQQERELARFIYSEQARLIESGLLLRSNRS